MLCVSTSAKAFHLPLNTLREQQHLAAIADTKTENNYDDLEPVITNPHQDKSIVHRSAQNHVRSPKLSAHVHSSSNDVGSARNEASLINIEKQEIVYIKDMNDNGKIGGPPLLLRNLSPPEPQNRKSKKYSSASPLSSSDYGNFQTVTKLGTSSTATVNRPFRQVHQSSNKTGKVKGTHERKQERNELSKYNYVSEKDNKVSSNSMNFTNAYNNNEDNYATNNDTSITILANIASFHDVPKKISKLNHTRKNIPKVMFFNDRNNLSPILPTVNIGRSVRQMPFSPTPKSYIIHRRTKICIYEGRTYKVGERVPTSEPCLECICYERTIICGLRVCPKTSLLKDQLGRCHVKHVEGKCCPDIKCMEGGKNTIIHSGLIT